MSNESLYKAEEAKKLQLTSSLPALAVIGVGVMLLAASLFDVPLIGFLWPGFVIVPGLLLLWPSYQSTAVRQHILSFLAVPGAILTAVGTLLLAMNLTNHFEAWAYSWPLVLVAAAAGLMYAKRFDPSSTIHQSGHQFMRVMVLAVIGLAIFFEIIIFDNFNPLLPLGLIAYGVYLWLRQRRSMSVA